MRLRFLLFGCQSDHHRRDALLLIRSSPRHTEGETAIDQLKPRAVLALNPQDWEDSSVVLSGSAQWIELGKEKVRR